MDIPCIKQTVCKVLNIFQHGKYIVAYVLKLAPDLKKNTVYLSSYIPLNGGHLSILTHSMLRTYTSDIEERVIL